MSEFFKINNNNILGVCANCTFEDNSFLVSVSNEVAKDYLINPDKYIYQNGEIVLNANYEVQKLAKAKEDKKEENLNKANEAILNGYVTYKNCKFETNTDNQSNMTSTANLMQTQSIEKTQWLSKDNILIELTLEDFLNIGGLILSYKTNLWTNIYAGIEAQIESAQTIEEVNNIVITYGNMEE